MGPLAIGSHQMSVLSACFWPLACQAWRTVQLGLPNGDPAWMYRNTENKSKVTDRQ